MQVGKTGLIISLVALLLQNLAADELRKIADTLEVYRVDAGQVPSYGSRKPDGESLLQLYANTGSHGLQLQAPWRIPTTAVG